MSSLQALLDKQEKGSTSGQRGYSGGDWSSNKQRGNYHTSSYYYRDDNNNFRRERHQPHSSRDSYSRRDDDNRVNVGRWNLKPASSPHQHNHNNIRDGRSTKSAEPTYEERRANIERRAIEDSCRSSRNSSCTNSRWNTNSSSKQVNGAAQSIEEDIASLQSWVGPLVDGKQCTYYQDRDKRYPFYTNEVGYNLLQQLMERNKALLHINHKLLEERASKESYDGVQEEEVKKDVIIRIGQGLYAHKPTLRTKGVTWSTEEYSHPGLQRMYLRMKSIQRFTEVWCLLERCNMLGMFDGIIKRGEGILRIASIGGGPGYELLATKLFFADKAPNVELELISMDLCPAWTPFVEELGFKFIQYDINNEEGINPLQAAELERGDIHFCIVSCLMIYCTNEKVLNMFKKLTHYDGVNAILVSERGERTKACSMLEELGGEVIRLIDQSNGMDERQAIWCSKEYANEKLQCSPDYQAHQNESIFPNVPYCEHKKRGGRSGR